ncbi:lytic polysaccharide monooxygenase [Rhodococcus sp. ABRD24]|uniref:lytic polysaccharide monooxygenase n=1 Tax=Rhodococcus sp. ABRD24 TaxID=2507582 RepID=UPI001A956247|nr:lytic polysaccharide monooxygenase [Rhodococcus sp. ABRD24]
MKRIVTAGAGLLVASAVVLGSVSTASAHGYVSGSIVARQAATQNVNRGAVQYEPQSLEAPKGFPQAGPVDGKLASAGGLFGGNLDEQSSTRWYKNRVRSGPNQFTWTFTAPHRTSQWRYYITKTGWDPNAPLTRSELELITTVQHDGSAASSNPTHTIAIPADRKGYHVVYAVWDIADTSNAFYNAIDLDIVDSGTPPADTTAPSAPSDPVAGDVTAGSVRLSWATASDNVGVAGYRVFRNGHQVGVSTGPTYTDTGLAPSTRYSYTIRAVDAAGNVSGDSAAVTVTTAAVPAVDVTAPSAPTGLHSMGTTSSSVSLMWTAATDNVGVHHYDVLRAPAGTADTFAKVGTTTGTTFESTGLAASTTYRYRVVAFDAAGNATAGTPFTVTTKATGSTPTQPIGTWNARAAYVKGDRVTHGGRTYECVQSYRGVGDPNWINAPSLWKLV